MSGTHADKYRTPATELALWAVWVAARPIRPLAVLIVRAAVLWYLELWLLVALVRDDDPFLSNRRAPR